MRKLFNDEAGFVVSAELVLVLTIAVLGMAVGLAAVRDSITSELIDISNAFGAVNQSFTVNGVMKGTHGTTPGFGFADRGDDCDCVNITFEVTGVKLQNNTSTAESTVGTP